MLIDQFISYIEAEKRYSPLTVEAYQSDMDQFAHFLKDEYGIDDLTQVKTTMVKSYIVHLKEEGLVNRSINRKTSTLRTFYKYCLRENLIEKSPMTGIKALKQPKTLVKFVTEIDINKVSFGEEADFSTQRDHLLFELLYQTGMRQAELRGLEDSDVDKMDMQLKIHGKRNKDRLVPLSREMIQLIVQYQVLRDATFTTKIRRIDRIKVPFPGNGNGTFSKALPIAQQEVCKISIRRIMLHVLTEGIVDAAGFTHTLLPFSQASAVGK